jgi:glycosyltransferase involved in cell wall biosynthesis
MEKDLFFSIIIPTYNRAHMIAETLTTTFQQTYPHYEIIIVDDGSTDNTEAVIRAINNPKVRYHKKQNEERAVARNIGIELAKGEYIILLDSDDFLYSNHLEETYKYILINNNPEIIRFDYDIVDSNRSILKQIIMPDNVNEKIILGNYLGCSGIVLKRDIAILHKFNVNRALSGSEDYELWLRLAARYKIHTSRIITSSLHAHKERSVLLNTDEEALRERITLLIKYPFEDKSVSKKFVHKKNVFISYCMIYISLHLAIANLKLYSIKYLFKSIKLYPFILTDIRIYGVLKTLVFN